MRGQNLHLKGLIGKKLKICIEIKAEALESKFKHISFQTCFVHDKHRLSKQIIALLSALSVSFQVSKRIL